MATKKNTPNADPAAPWQNRIVGEGTVALERWATHTGKTPVLLNE